MTYVAAHQQVNLADLNALADRLGLGRRVGFDAASWNALIDLANERSYPDLPPLPRHRRGAVLTSDAWNALVERINELESR